MLRRRKFLKSIGVTTTVTMAGLGQSETAKASEKPRTFVLVHGAWHGGWCWRRVSEILLAHGHRVFAPSLTGVGDRVHLFSKDISLQTHVNDILSLVDSEELKGFVLVGHSYGGMAISAAADTLRDQVAHYIYLDARLPFDMSPGTSFSWSGFDGPDLREARMKSVHEQGNDVGLPAPPPTAFAVTRPDDAAWVRRRMCPMPLQTYIGSFTFRNSGSNGLKRTYIAAVKPAYPTLVPTHDRIKQDSSWFFKAMEAGHDAMVTAPELLASLLMQD